MTQPDMLYKLCFTSLPLVYLFLIITSLVYYLMGMIDLLLKLSNTKYKINMLDLFDRSNNGLVHPKMLSVIYNLHG